MPAWSAAGGLLTQCLAGDLLLDVPAFGPGLESVWSMSTVCFSRRRLVGLQI